MAFTVPNFTKLTITLYIFMDSFYSEFYPDGKKKVKSKGRMTLMQLLNKWR